MPAFSVIWRHEDSTADSCWGQDMEDFLACVPEASEVRVVLSVQRRQEINGQLLWFGSNKILKKMERELHFQSSLTRDDIMENVKLSQTFGAHQLFQTLQVSDPC